MHTQTHTVEIPQSIATIAYIIGLEIDLAEATKKYETAKLKRETGKYPLQVISGNYQLGRDFNEECRLLAKVYEIKSLIADQAAFA